MKSVSIKKKPRSAFLLDRGINSSTDCSEVLTALMVDVLHGDVTPRFANAVTSEIGKQLNKFGFLLKLHGRVAKMKFTETQLAKVGVEIVSESSASLKCAECGQHWSPMLRAGGKLPPRYWICPNGCNADDGRIAAAH